MSPITCPSGRKPRYRHRKIRGGRTQRLAFCNNKVVETTTVKKKPIGWRRETARHSLAARGIRSSRKTRTQIVRTNIERARLHIKLARKRTILGKEYYSLGARYWVPKTTFESLKKQGVTNPIIYGEKAIHITDIK